MNLNAPIESDTDSKVVAELNVVDNVREMFVKIKKRLDYYI